MADQVLTPEKLISGMPDRVQMAPDAQRETKTTSLTKADIPMWMQFDLGGVQLSLMEIEQLTPGQTLLLGRDPELPVQLKCCGQTIALARLVQINSQLAIQIAKLRPRHERPFS